MVKMTPQILLKKKRDPPKKKKKTKQNKLREDKFVVKEK